MGLATRLGDGGETVVGQHVAVGVCCDRGRIEEVLASEHNRDERRRAFHVDRRGLRQRGVHGEDVGLAFHTCHGCERNAEQGLNKLSASTISLNRLRKKY